MHPNLSSDTCSLFLGLVRWWWWRNIKSCEGEMEGHWSWWLRCRWGWSMPCTFYTKFSVSTLMANISVDRKNEVIVQVLMLPLICMCCLLIISFFVDTSFGCIIWYFSCMFLWGSTFLTMFVSKRRPSSSNFSREIWPLSLTPH